MKVVNTRLKDCVVIEPKVFGDSRGYFLETFQAERYKREAGIDIAMVQDNRSRSNQGVLRGLHFQRSKPQGKLVQAVAGEIFDVAVDLRASSATFGGWEGVVLSAENKRQLWVPPGFAHGFLVLSETAEVEYKCTAYYEPADEGAIRWDDPDLAVAWPKGVGITLSEKDAAAPLLKDCILR